MTRHEHNRRHRLTDFIARLMAKRWDERIPQESLADPETSQDGSGPLSSSAAVSSSAREGQVEANDENLLGPEDVVTVRGSAHDLLHQLSGDVRPNRAEPSGPDLARPLTLERIEAMLTGPMGYDLQRHEEEGHPCLLGSWDTFPFVIEVPDEHEGWLLVSGEWLEPARPGERDEIAASVNDWNRDKFFPTVALIDTEAGPLVRAGYLMDLTAGVSDNQLRLHLDTALSSCTQALSLIGPLLPEL